MDGSVAVVLSGPPDHFSSHLVDRHAARTAALAARRIDFARELATHIIHPLLTFFDVTLLAMCESDEASGWHTFLSSAALRPALFARRLTVHVDAAPAAASSCSIQCSDFATKVRYGCACLPEQASTLFVDERPNKYIQWAKLARAVAALQSLESQRGHPFTHVVKARHDFIYRPDHFFDPKWLLLLGERDIGVPAQPFQAPLAGYYDVRRHDWQAPWPFNGINDQIAIGRREVMLKYLAIASPATARSVRGQDAATTACREAVASLPAGKRCTRAMRTMKRLCPCPIRTTRT